MGIDLEEILKKLEEFEEDFNYFLLCQGKQDDAKEWESRINLLRGLILDAFKKNK